MPLSIEVVSCVTQLWLFFAAFTLILFSKRNIWNPSLPDAFLLFRSVMYMWLLTTKYISLANICVLQMFVVLHALSSKRQRYRHRDSLWQINWWQEILYLLLILCDWQLKKERHRNCLQNGKDHTSFSHKDSMKNWL